MLGHHIQHPILANRGPQPSLNRHPRRSSNQLHPTPLTKPATGHDTSVLHRSDKPAYPTLTNKITNCSEPGGYKANGARITNTGSFDWVVGDLGDLNGITTMEYTQTYSALGWIIEPSRAGTRFTNQATGHGMLVNTEQVAHF